MNHWCLKLTTKREDSLLLLSFVNSVLRQHDYSYNRYPHCRTIIKQLSEEFIEEFQDEIGGLWAIIWRDRELTEDFVRKFIHKIKWDEFVKNHSMMSDKFYEEFDKFLRQKEDNKYYYMYGSTYHRTLGPAAEGFGKSKYFFYRGQRVDCKNMKEYKRWLKLRAFA